MQILSPILLSKLEESFDKISDMYMEGKHLEEIENYLDISHEDMHQIEGVMFATKPLYSVKDITGNQKVMQFNAYTLQSKEVRP